MRNHDVYDKIKINGSSGCFISLKDHKENFINIPTVRLLNPAKNEVGRISKIILSQSNIELKNKLLVNQWQSTLIVNGWFKKIKDKHLYKFLIFDFNDLCPSI